MLFQLILDFDNKLKEGTKNFNELKILIIKDASKWVQFYEAAAVQPTYLLEGSFRRKF